MPRLYKERLDQFAKRVREGADVSMEGGQFRALGEDCGELLAGFVDL